MRVILNPGKSVQIGMVRKGLEPKEFPSLELAVGKILGIMNFKN